MIILHGSQRPVFERHPAAVAGRTTDSAADLLLFTPSLLRMACGASCQLQRHRLQDQFGPWLCSSQRHCHAITCTCTILLVQERVALQRMESQNQGTVAQDDVLVPAHHPGQVKTHGAAGAGPYFLASCRIFFFICFYLSRCGSLISPPGCCSHP